MQTVQEVTEHGLRERKRRQTHEALCLAAREAVLERGLDKVTVEEIAAAAGVSPRTFFNYFSCKEEAVVGVEPAVLAEVADELRRRPADESPAEALQAVLYGESEVEGLLRRTQLRNELVRTYPALLPRHLAAMVQVEETLADALAERLGVDLHTDPSPRALVAAALAVVRSTLAWWSEHPDPDTDLTALLDRTFARVVADPHRNR